MTVELVIFVGLQASGKTTLYHERFAAYVHVSKDHWPNYRYPEKRQRAVVEDALRSGRSVVVDNTNPTVADRAPLIAIGRAVGALVTAYRFTSTLAESLLRNESRTGRARIKDVGLYACHNKLVSPALSEGFDRIFSVSVTKRGLNVAPLDAMEGRAS